MIDSQSKPSADKIAQRAIALQTELTKRELNEVEIIFEKRQKALNWLSGENPDWDAVETDTNGPNQSLR